MTVTKTSARTATADLLQRLERHYIKPGADYPGGIFLPEVTYGGAGGPRADALYVGFTSASGRVLVGHEVKVSRADWRRELDKAGKADTWADECHAWYVVAPSTDIVPAEEVPHGWGLMVINPRTTTRLDIVVKPTVRADHTPSWTAARSLLSRVDTLRAQIIWDAKQKATADAHRDVEARVEQRLQNLVQRDDAGRLRAQLDGIFAALGVRRIEADGRRTSWAGEDWLTLADLEASAAFLRAYRDVASAAEQLRSRFNDPIGRTREHLDALDKAIESLQALTTQPTAEEATP